MRRRRMTVRVVADLVLEVECGSRIEAARVAVTEAVRLLDQGAKVAASPGGILAASVTWPSASREVELRSLGRVDKDTFEAAVRAALALVVEAADAASARGVAEPAARRIVGRYARVESQDPRVIRAVVCRAGETTTAV